MGSPRTPLRVKIEEATFRFSRLGTQSREDFLGGESCWQTLALLHSRPRGKSIIKPPLDRFLVTSQTPDVTVDKQCLPLLKYNVDWWRNTGKTLLSCIRNRNGVIVKSHS